MPNTGRVTAPGASQQRDLPLVGREALVLGGRVLGAVAARIDVAAARQQQPVERVERGLWIVAVRQDQREAAGGLHGLRVLDAERVEVGALAERRGQRAGARP